MPAGEAGGEEGGADESPLLAVPHGSRNEPRLTPGAKGKVYYPKKVDGRPAGARKRSMDAKYNREKASATIRNVVPGAEIGSLAKMGSLGNGIYEGQAPIYNASGLSEEEKLFHVSDSIRALLKGLEGLENNNEG